MCGGSCATSSVGPVSVQLGKRSNATMPRSSGGFGNGGPQQKKGPAPGALIVFEDESGVSLLPAVRATWAPRGQTPVLRHRFGWKRLSLAAALVFEPDASDAHLVFQLRPGAYNGEA